MPVYALDEHAPELPEPGRFWIAPDAHLIGRVRLGLDVSVWFGAVLRGDNEPVTVGERSNVQEGALLHTDPGCPLALGADCTVGHRAILHGCSVGNGSLVGMGAVVLNRARIGAGSLVGAGALVTEGKEFPDGALILGSPARMARPLGPEEAARLVASARRYVANGRRFATRLRRLDEVLRSVHASVATTG